jgi:hypothetical protein
MNVQVKGSTERNGNKNELGELFVVQKDLLNLASTALGKFIQGFNNLGGLPDAISFIVANLGKHS